MQNYAEEAVYEHMNDLQKMFSKECLNKKNAPFAWNISKQEIEGIMNSSVKRSDRYRQLKEDGLSHEKIIEIFHKPVSMRVYSLRGDIDTILSPYDSIKYYKSLCILPHSTYPIWDMLLSFAMILQRLQFP